MRLTDSCAHSFARHWKMPFLNQRNGEGDRRKYFMINFHEKMLPTRRGSNPQPPDHKSDAHPTEPQRLAIFMFYGQVQFEIDKENPLVSRSMSVTSNQGSQIIDSSPSGC